MSDELSIPEVGSSITGYDQDILNKCEKDFTGATDSEIEVAKKIFLERAAIPAGTRVSMYQPVRTAENRSATQSILFRFTVGPCDYFMRLKEDSVIVSRFSYELDAEYIRGAALFMLK